MRNAIIILVNMLPCFLLSQCPEATHQKLIATYQAVASNMYDSYWAEWETVPKNLLLIGDELEYYFGSQYSDTTFLETCEGIPSRPATLSKHFLATFPYINYQPTIIIGTPENTKQTPMEWTVTLLHEHFHQLQFSHPDYNTAQKSLQLDKGDQTGMWMLNHPFPYEDHRVVKQVNQITKNLLLLQDAVDVQSILKQHRILKEQLKTIIGDEHYRYLNLQLWQEGYARFMELSILEHWITNFEHIDQKRFDQVSLDNYLKSYKIEILNSLTAAPINESKRVYFYALGAAEALLIEEVNPEWKRAYFDELFTTDHLLKD